VVQSGLLRIFDIDNCLLKRIDFFYVVFVEYFFLKSLFDYDRFKIIFAANKFAILIVSFLLLHVLIVYFNRIGTRAYENNF
jgi:hypothetical protein